MVVCDMWINYVFHVTVKKRRSKQVLFYIYIQVYEMGLTVFIWTRSVAPAFFCASKVGPRYFSTLESEDQGLRTAEAPCLGRSQGSLCSKQTRSYKVSPDHN